jgi:hypothetical protein
MIFSHWYIQSFLSVYESKYDCFGLYCLSLTKACLIFAVARLLKNHHHRQPINVFTNGTWALFIH